MAEKLNYLKAVEYDKLPATFRKKYPSVEALQKAGWWLQLKYDGCYGKAIVSLDPSRRRMLSRTGEDYTASTRHILDDLARRATAQYGAFEDFVVLGEVWHPKWPFPTISGAFRRQAAAPDLRFACHDILTMDMESSIPYRDRYLHLYRLLGFPVAGNISFIVDNHRSGDWFGTALDWALKWKARGNYDGVVLRNPEGWYYPGLVKHGEIVKVKPVLALDLRIDEVLVDTGEKTGRDVYTIKVTYRGVQSSVGSGVPHNFKFGPGAIAEIECMGLTADGRLREPRFKGIRHDKETPDV
jgi:ATP-dependent DNA ligase